MSSSSSNNGNGGTPGRRRFFNDRRFTVAGPQRLRQNVQDLLSQVNRQFVSDNPHLLHELADQLNRLQEILGSNPSGNNVVAGAANFVASTPPGTAVPVRQDRNQISAIVGQSNQQESLASGPLAFQNNADPLDNNTDGQYLSDDDDDNNADGQNAGHSGLQNESVILNMEIDSIGNLQVEGLVRTNDTQQPTVAQADQPQQGPAGQAPAPNAEVEWQRLVASLRAPEMQRIVRIVTNVGPFLIILLLKWMLTYATSMIMLTLLVATFFYVENVVETVVVATRSQQSPKWRLLFAVALMGLNIGALYYFFADERLYLALLFQPTEPLLNDDGISFLTLLWLVVTADFMAKFLFIMAKCLVVSGPALVANRRMKAQTYQWLEYTCHMYRHWLPILPWCCYLTASGPDSGFIFNGLCTLLFLAYLFLKVKLFRPKLGHWWRSTITLLRPTSFGLRPSTTELMKIGPTCSICYGEFTNPVQLSCKHIFCDECVMTWLDKQKTCPMCRTQVITGDNDWKDGKTSYCIQFV